MAVVSQSVLTSRSDFAVWVPIHW